MYLVNNSKMSGKKPFTARLTLWLWQLTNLDPKAHVSSWKTLALTPIIAATRPFCYQRAIEQTFKYFYVALRIVTFILKKIDCQKPLTITYFVVRRVRIRKMLTILFDRVDQPPGTIEIWSGHAVYDWTQHDTLIYGDTSRTFSDKHFRAWSDGRNFSFSTKHNGRRIKSTH